MNHAAKSNFRQRILASGLLSSAALAESVRQLQAGGRWADVPTPEADRQLADFLVDTGRLTRFQTRHLLAGLTKFKLGQYRIVDSIGRGGMGQVFRAEHEFVKRTVAIKVLPKHKSTPDAIASFTREIRAQAQLDHENLVQALDAGHDGQVYFLVCEYIPGTDLRRYVRDRGPLGMAEAATIVSQAAQGLQYAHEHGLIHRDVKPGNLLVTPRGHTKVSDLGLAWLDDGEYDPRAAKVVGTADYLSPEQILSPSHLGPASDVYSLGCTLYYAVTGKVPFPGGSARDKVRRHCEDTPLHPRVLNPSLSQPFVDVIAAMMAKDPSARVPSMANVLHSLRPWAGESVSSPLDPEAARRRREEGGVDTGSEELVDTAESFPDFGFDTADRATPAHAETDPSPVVAAVTDSIARRESRRARQFWFGVLTAAALIGAALAALRYSGAIGPP